MLAVWIVLTMDRRLLGSGTSYVDKAHRSFIVYSTGFARSCSFLFDNSTALGYEIQLKAGLKIVRM
jgi:hypothetical protein